MSTNPNNAIGTNGAFGGRTSVNAFNDDLSAWTRGVMSGWACVPDSGMTIKIGGDATTRDVAVAEDNSGNKTTINNISGLPVSLTISGAPASNTRIDSVVAYVDNPPQGVSTVADNASACGIIVVEGTASSTPVAPDDTAIRTAITADGATGTTAYYAVLANITVANGTTTITSGEINAGDVSALAGSGVVKSQNIDFATFIVSNQDSTEKAASTAFADALSVDISSIPIGSKFLVIFTASASGTNEINGYFLRIRYGNEYSIIYGQGNSWGKNVAGQCVFTKLDGQNDVVLQHKKDQPDSVIGTARACSCIVVK